MSRALLGKLSTWFGGNGSRWAVGGRGPAYWAVTDAARACVEGLEGRVLFASTLLSNGGGDGSLVVTVDAYGAFGSASGSAGNAIYDPVGSSLPAAGTTFASGVYFSPVDTFLSEGGLGGTSPLAPVNFLSATGTSAISQFTLAGFDITLTQSVTPFDGEGSNLVQSYSIENTTGSTQNFVMVRHIDGDLQFVGAQDNDSAGASADGQFLFEFDGGDPSQAQGFVSIVNQGGTHAGFLIREFGGNFVEIVNANGIPPGLLNQILQNGADADLNNDRLTDDPDGYDVTLTLQNNLSVPAGGTVTFVAITRFGQGQPADVLSPGQVRFESATFTETEGDRDVTINLVRESGTSGAITVDYATTGGTAAAGQDYQPTSGTVSFASGQRTASFTVRLLDDQLQEQDETVLLALSNPTNQATLGTIPNATLVIQDNEPGVRFSQSTYSLAEGTDVAPAVAFIVVNRVGDPSVPFTVDFATSNGTATTDDYEAVSQTLEFQAGETSKTIPIDVFDDFEAEPTETVNLTLSNPSSGIALTASTATLQITDTGRPFSVVRAQFETTGARIDGILVRFNRALIEERAEDLNNYYVHQIKETRFGRRPSRKLIPLASATYDPVSQTVLLRTVKPLKDNIFYEVSVNTTRETGIRTVEFEFLDGDQDNLTGDDFLAYLGRGHRLQYIDRNGDRVRLDLEGPGKMELFRRVLRNTDELRFLATDATNSIVTGTVRSDRKAPSSDGKAILDELTGTPVRIELDPAQFSIGINKIGRA